MASIKAIETVYNGYRFRSRLEARWAVFFDVGKIRYEYEPEGFEFEDGTRWLPDFYLPDLDCYVEVKPDTPDGVNEILTKVKPFIRWGGKIKQILILSDIPGEIQDRGIWHFPCFYWHANGVKDGWWFFYSCYDISSENVYLNGNVSGADYITWNRSWNKREETHIIAKSDFDAGMYANPKRLEIRLHIDPIYGDKRDWVSNLNKTQNALVFSAIRSARQARFEHGETPRVERR